MSTATLEPPAARPGFVRAPGRDRVYDTLAIAVPSLLAAALVLYELGTRSLWLDEGATVAITAQHGAALWHAIARDGGNMAGYYVFMHVLTGLFGHAPALIRAPAAVGFIGTVGFVSLLARRLFGTRAALASGVLCAVSVPLVFWGQNARSYALMTMFIAASFVALVALLEAPGSRRAWVGYAGAIVLATYMSFVAVLVVPAQLIGVWLRGGRERVRAVVSALAVAGALCVPIAVLAIARGSSQLFWVPAASLKRFGEMARWLTSAGMPPNFHRTATGTPALILSALVLAAVLIGVVRAARAGRRSWQVGLIVAWLLVPPALILAESLAGQPIALARNSLVSLPAFALVIGWGITRWRVSAWLSWSVLGVLIALRATQLVPSYGASSENWKAAAQHLLRASRAGDCIAFYPSDGRMAFGYYVPSGAGAPAPTPVLPSGPWTQTTPYVERYLVPSATRLARISGRCPRLWLIASHEGSRTGPTGSRANYARYQALRGALARTYTFGASAKYGWASPVRVQLLVRRAS